MRLTVEECHNVLIPKTGGISIKQKGAEKMALSAIRIDWTRLVNLSVGYFAFCSNTFSAGLSVHH